MKQLLTRAAFAASIAASVTASITLCMGTAAAQDSIRIGAISPDGKSTFGDMVQTVALVSSPLPSGERSARSAG